jgi:hypothetical protein
MTITDQFVNWGILFEPTTQIYHEQSPGDAASPPNMFAPGHTLDEVTFDATFVMPNNPNVLATVPWVEITQDYGAASGPVVFRRHPGNHPSIGSKDSGREPLTSVTASGSRNMP